MDDIEKSHIPRWNSVADAIAKRRAVAFVGAGVSATVGLPTWAKFLAGQVEAARTIYHCSSVDMRKIDETSRRGDLPLTASLLKRAVGRPFMTSITNTFGATRPGPAHRAVARLPFAHVITTNYDALLDKALAELQPKLKIIVNSRVESILDRLQEAGPCLIKLHGHVSIPEGAVIAEDDFRSIQRHGPLIQCLRLLFLTNHLVFIGHGLRDPDLLGLLSDLRHEFPNVGPHYALLDDPFDTPCNSSESFIYYLENSLNVHAIVYRYGSREPGTAHTNREDAMVHHLTSLHGEVSRRIGAQSGGIGPATESQESRLKDMLRHACKVTGSLRGDLAFFNDEKYSGWANSPGRGEIPVRPPGLYIDYSYEHASDAEPTNPSVAHAFHHEKPNRAYVGTEIWNAFHLSRDARAIESADNTGTITSHLPVPIYVGESRVGVLHLESNIPKAYTDDHVAVAVDMAREIGITWDRAIRSDILRDATLNPNPSQSVAVDAGEPPQKLIPQVLSLLPAEKRDVTCALFVANHSAGILQPSATSTPRATNTVQPFRFEDRSFAAMIFRKGRPMYLGDRHSSPSWVQIDELRAGGSGVASELVGVPLFARALRIGVLTAWMEDLTARLGADGSEMITLTAQLFARANYLQQITQFRSQYTDTAKACRSFWSALQALPPSGLGPDAVGLPKLLECIRSMVGVERVRLFWAKRPCVLTRYPSMEFECVSSIWRGGVFPAHHGRPNHSNNPFVRHILRRSCWSSTAMLFYKDLLVVTPSQFLEFEGLPSSGGDPATAVFGRHPEVGWYVAPITWCESFGPADTETHWSKETRWMLGFLTVDNTVDPRGKPLDNELPPSRTWHDLTRLKLSWCATMMGYHFRQSILQDREDPRSSKE